MANPSSSPVSNYRPAHLFDSRVVARYIEEGLITLQEYEQFVASQPDLAAACDWVDVFTDGDLNPSRPRSPVRSSDED